MTLDLTKPIRSNQAEYEFHYVARLPDNGPHVLAYKDSDGWGLTLRSDEGLRKEFENVPEVKESWHNVYTAVDGIAVVGDHYASREQARIAGSSTRIAYLRMTYDGTTLTAEVLPATEKT